MEHQIGTNGEGPPSSLGAIDVRQFEIEMLRVTKALTVSLSSLIGTMELPEGASHVPGTSIHDWERMKSVTSALPNLFRIPKFRGMAEALIDSYMAWLRGISTRNSDIPQLSVVSEALEEVRMVADGLRACYGIESPLPVDGMDSNTIAASSSQ